MLIDWNLKFLYNNVEKWNNDYDRLTILIPELDSLLENLLNNENSFLNFLNKKRECLILIEKLYCYAKRHLDIDSTQPNFQKMVDDVLKINNKFEEINNKFENVLQKNENLIKKLLNNKCLRKYKRYIYLILRKKQHAFSDSSKYLSYVNSIQEIKNKYQLLFTSSIKFNDVIIDGVVLKLDRNNYRTLILNEKQENRKVIFDTYTDAYIKINDTLANWYIEKIKNDINISKLEKYDNLFDKKSFELELSNTIVSKLINTVNSNLNVMHNYIKFKKKISGLKEYHIYDVSDAVCRVPKVSYKLEDGINILKNSLKILGKDYISIIDKMFKEGWVDVYPKDKKRAMSFTCISYVGVPYILINYDDSLNSLRTLSHEIGHAINVYFSKNNNEFEYFEFSCFLSEIASKVNEILFNEYIIANCKNNDEIKYVLNNIISSIVNSVFGQTMITEFENTVINMLDNEENVDANVLNNLYFQLSKKYNGNDLVYDDNIKYGWSKIPHLIMQDTYYVYQYAIGTAIATNIAYRILNKENDIITKYKNFLSLGNSVSISEALKCLDIDLSKENYMAFVIEVLNQKINELKELYKL